MTSAFVSRFDLEKIVDSDGNVFAFSSNGNLQWGENMIRLIELNQERKRLIELWRTNEKDRARIAASGKAIAIKIARIKDKFESDFEDYHYGKKSSVDMIRLWYGHTQAGIFNKRIKTIVLNEDNNAYYLQFGNYYGDKI